MSLNEWAQGKGKGYKDYDEYSAQIRKNHMKQNFKIGDKVRLRDSPYGGVVTSTTALLVAFKYRDFEKDQPVTITVSDPSILEPVFDPKPGDVYKDKNGREWVIREGDSSYSSAPYLLAMLVDIVPRDRAHYPANQTILHNPEKIVDWGVKYKPVLVRRREQ